MVQKVVVFGATGMQGGGVVTALLKNKTFKVTAVTRNKKSEKAKELVKQGAKVVEGNLDDPKSLSKILSGCYGVFGVTNYWELLDANKEIQQGKNLIDACNKAGIKHLIFSTLQDAKEAIGKECPHFDTKAEIEKYMFASGVPSTSVRYPFYMENLLGFFMFSVKKDDNGEFAIDIPMEGRLIDVISAPGAGNAVAAIFASPDAYIGRTVRLSGDRKTVQQFADILNKHLAPKHSKPVRLKQINFPNLGIWPSCLSFIKVIR
ncbi:nmrA-like family domain-containing protein 1 [Amphiura filiformis]|uniref:nmrA-like family domain-containing protein 1 n=1 Tax=Amphiura filiformis TaxID=82378 RepID=UPI003B21824A